MKKIIGLMILITLATAGFVFAEGKGSSQAKDSRKEHNKKESNHNKNFKGKQHMMRAPQFSYIEIKEISGEIVIKENDHPTIKSGNNEVKIMLSPSVIQNLKLSTGSKISVKGVEVPALKKNSTDEKIIKVFELQYDERKFLIPPGNAGMNRSKTKPGPR